MTDHTNFLGIKSDNADRYLEQMSSEFDDKVSDLQERLQEAMEALKKDASDAVTLAHYQSVLGDYTTMRSAQSAAVKSMKEIAQGSISKF